MKMRNLFALFSLFFGMTCFARPALNVNIVGVSPGSTFSVISAGEGLTAEHPHWNKNESQRQRWIWAYSPEIVLRHCARKLGGSLPRAGLQLKSRPFEIAEFKQRIFFVRK